LYCGSGKGVNEDKKKVEPNEKQYIRESNEDLNGRGA